MYTGAGEPLETRPSNSPISSVRGPPDAIQQVALKQEARLSASSSLRKSVNLRQSPSLTHPSRFAAYVAPLCLLSLTRHERIVVKD